MTQRNDADSPWKIVLRAYFREAIDFYFPAIAAHIDWSIAPEFLDKEFVQITPDAEIGKRYADQLVRVQRKRGKPLILLLHLEVQAQKEKHFTARMFIYAIRIFELFEQPATSLALLCDANPNWRPSQHKLTSLGTNIVFDFTAVKLLDYQSQWAALEASPNPFAIITMAHLKTQETKKTPKVRQHWKFQLVRRLYEQGYNRSEVINLFKFIDWVMVLPKPQKSEFWRDLRTYEEQQQMPYITSVEEIGYERGREEGEQRGREEERRSLALKLIRRGIPLEIIAEDTELSIETLQQLQTQLESENT
jgi:predicted transposase/invertase (TIGR01784 family)